MDPTSTLTDIYGNELAAVTTTTEPTFMLRWVPLSMMQAHEWRLQQGFKVTTFHDGKPVSAVIEWRDVPFENYP